MEEWIKNNPNSHVLLLSATPINNSLTDIKNQLLLGTGGDPDRFYLNYIDVEGKIRILNWSEYIRRVEKEINKEIKETNSFDKERLKNQIAPIIRQFVVRRTRQGIRDRYGNLSIDDKVQLFPEANPELLEYSLKPEKLLVNKLKGLEPIIYDYLLYEPDQILDKTKQELVHPFEIINKNKFDLIDSNNHPMHIIFHLILLLGLVPYKWKIYKKGIYALERKDLVHLNLNLEEKQQLSMQLNFYGIFRTIFLKRMESSIYAFKLSIERYQKILDKFKSGINHDVFLRTKFIDKYLINDTNSDEFEVSGNIEELISELLNSSDFENNEMWEEFNREDYEIEYLLEDIERDKLVCEVIVDYLEIIKKTILN